MVFLNKRSEFPTAIDERKPIITGLTEIKAKNHAEKNLSEYSVSVPPDHDLFVNEQSKRGLAYILYINTSKKLNALKCEEQMKLTLRSVWCYFINANNLRVFSWYIYVEAPVSRKLIIKNCMIL